MRPREGRSALGIGDAVLNLPPVMNDAQRRVLDVAARAGCSVYASATTNLSQRTVNANAARKLAEMGYVARDDGRPWFPNSGVRWRWLHITDAGRERWLADSEVDDGEPSSSA